jgi:NitT/TauT family transport system permease protein
MEDVLKALGATRWQVLWNVGLPRSLPYFFASLKIAITLAFVGTVLSETVAANRGIGTVMVMASANFDMPLAFAGLTALAILGILLYAVFALVERRVCGWAVRKTELAVQ